MVRVRSNATASQLLNNFTVILIGFQHIYIIFIKWVCETRAEWGSNPRPLISQTSTLTTTPCCGGQNEIRTETTNARPYIQAPHVNVLIGDLSIVRQPNWPIMLYISFLIAELNNDKRVYFLS